MNERFTFIVAAFLAELAASTAIFELSSANPICAAFSDLATYSGQHTAASFVLWLLAFGGGLLFAGAALLRHRQSLSTKLQFLARLCLIGIIIDTLVSLYQLESTREVIIHNGSTTAVVLGLGIRSVVYVLTFSAVVFMGYVAGKNRKEIVTPPPRFGRH